MKNALPPRQWILWLWALALCLPPAIIPVYNHDLFWHLSAARWIWAHHSLPTIDFLSWTKAGTPWLDFEWLWDILAAAFYRQAGLAGLLILKFALFLANAWALLRLLSCRKIQAPWSAAALVLWALQMLPRCSAQPELVSLLCFTITLNFLENGRAEGPAAKQPWKDLALTFFLFAAWSQVHAAFIMGLALFPCYALVDAWDKRPQAALAKLLAAGAAVLGSLCNPYGVGPYKILLQHLRESSAMTSFIREWSAMPLRDPFYWPFWIALAILAALTVVTIAVSPPPKPSPLGRAQGEGNKIPWSLVLVVTPLALLALRHARFSSYFNAPACLLAAVLAQNVFQNSSRLSRRLPLFFFTGCSAFYLYFLPRIHWTLSLSSTDLPQAAANFMDHERPVIAPLKLYHPWEWGGYLGWRLRPWFKVFGDGRYIFHEQHAQAEEAFGSSAQWQDYLKHAGADGALLPNVDILISSQRRYPDGTLKTFRRPWFVFYMPRPRWALVYWDSRSLLFIERSAAPASWLKSHEYRYLHPKDAPAFEDALRRGDINRRQLGIETARHQEEMRELGGS